MTEEQPDMRQEIIALRDYFRDARKLTVPEAVDVMLNAIPYQLRFQVSKFDLTATETERSG